MKDINTIIDAINATGDLSAEMRGDKIKISVYGRPAGTITEDDVMDAVESNTATGWTRSKGLKKGAMQVFRAIQSD